MNGHSPHLTLWQRTGSKPSRVRRTVAHTHAELVDQPHVSETIIRGQLVTLLKPSNRNANRVIVRWRDQDWLISFSAWEAAEPQSTRSIGLFV